jgi:uridine kinase
MGNVSQKCECILPTVIGISGPTRSGKTSLCNGILGKYPNCKYVNQDHFFDKVLQISISSNFKAKMPLVDEERYDIKRNWETVDGINWEDFASAIEKAISQGTQKCTKCAPSPNKVSQPSFVVVEGK